MLLLARALHSRTERGTTHVEVFRGTGSPGDCGPRAVVQKVHAKFPPGGGLGPGESAAPQAQQHRHEAEVRHWRRPWVVLLGLLSVIIPFLPLFAFSEPVGITFDHPARVSYYLQTVLLLGLGLALGISALVWGRMMAPPWIRYLSWALGALGIAASMLFLLTLIGLCGPTVLWGYCQP